MADEHPLARWAGLEQVLQRHGVSWEALCAGSEQLVLFGSRAAGVAGPGSDFDLLCIGTGRTLKSRWLDLVCMTPERVASRQWLGSELAGHVARHGLWLWGEPTWVDRVWRSSAALAHKASLIADRLKALEQGGELLDATYQEMYLRLIRRDLQRHEYLRLGEAVPPTAWLDMAWKQMQSPEAELQRLLAGVGLPSPHLLGWLAEQEEGRPFCR